MDNDRNAVIKTGASDRALSTAFFAAIFAVMVGWLYVLFRIADKLMPSLI